MTEPIAAAVPGLFLATSVTGLVLIALNLQELLSRRRRCGSGSMAEPDSDL